MCAKLIVLSGCAEVVYRSDPKPDRQSYTDSREMLKANGVRIRESSGAHQAPCSVGLQNSARACSGEQPPSPEEIKAGAARARSSPARKNYRRTDPTSSAAGQGCPTAPYVRHRWATEGDCKPSMAFEECSEVHALLTSAVFRCYTEAQGVLAVLCISAWST
ncbi:hypothetical protein DIPPA_14816 [Diplonema papillatum]|nr:hypothetical protein DIPPA_14816 [Diplonema papillatum]